MEFFMSISVQTLEFISFLVTSITEEKIITILTHPATLINSFLAIEAFIFLLLVKLRLKHGLEFMIGSMRFWTI